MYEGPIQDLIDELGRLPGIGPKSAQRLAFHILAADPDDVMRLAATLQKVKETVKFCEICFNVSQDTQCRICRDLRRDETTICVVEEAKDVVAVERTREFRGRYHVLGGAISPIDGIGPAELGGRAGQVGEHRLLEDIDEFEESVGDGRNRHAEDRREHQQR